MRVNHTGQKKRPRTTAFKILPKGEQMRNINTIASELRELTDDMRTDPLFSAIAGGSTEEEFDPATIAEIMSEAREEIDE